MDRDWVRVWRLPALEGFCDAASLLQLHDANRAAQKQITVEQVMQKLAATPVCWESADSSGDFEGTHVTIQDGWRPELSTQEAVIQCALSKVNLDEVDGEYAEGLLRERGWLDRDDFDSEGEAASEEALSDDEVHSDSGWNVSFTFIRNLSARDAKSRARQILDLLKVRDEDEDLCDSPQSDEAEEGSESKGVLRKCVAWLLKLAEKKPARMQYADWHVSSRHTDLPSSESMLSLMLQFGEACIQITGCHEKQVL